MNKKKQEIKVASDKWRESEKLLRAELAECSQLTSDLRRVHSEVVSNRKQGRETKLDEADGELKVQTDLIKTLTDKIDKYGDEIAEKESDRANMSQVLSTLSANIAYIDLEAQLADMKDKIVGLEDEMKKIPNSKSYQKDLDGCHEEKQALKERKAKQEGGLQQLKKQIREQEEKLKNGKMRDVTEKTRQKRVEVETTNMAVEDLDKYFHALDKALMKYHSVKIQEINRIIRELWTNTYQVSLTLFFKLLQYFLAYFFCFSSILQCYLEKTSCTCAIDRIQM